MPRGLRRALLVLGFGFAVFLGGPNQAARANTYTVTTTADSGAGSLRQAILDANANAGPDNVFFAIPGGGVHVITLSTALPSLTQPVSIDGTTQTGYANVPLVQVRPSVAGAFDGFFIPATATASTIKGLSITEFNRGIVAQAQANFEANYIGLTPAGVAAGNAVGIRSSANGQQGLLNNVISSNTNFGVDIVGTSVTTDVMALNQNRIGTTPDGLTARPNGVGVRLHDTKFTVQDNTISGNTGDGIQVEFTQASNNLGSFIQLNRIGVKQDFSALGNGGNGVLVTYSGTDPANVGMQIFENTIANNAGNGVRVVQAAGVEIIDSAFYDNTLLDIDLVDATDGGITPNDVNDVDFNGTAPNRLQNYPVMIGAADDGGQITAAATLDTLANTSYLVDFYVSQACRADGHGPGAIHVGSTGFTTGNGAGDRTFNSSPFAAVPGYNVITATATVIGPEPNTSEFSNCVSPSTATVDIGDASVNENVVGSVVNVPLTLSAPAPIGAFISVTSQDGSATLGNNDYNNASGFVFVPAGATSASVPVTINDDVIDEINETLTLTLSSPGPGLVLNDNMATVTINDDDVPKIYVTGPTVNEGDPNGFVAVTVGADVPPVQDATVTLSTSNLEAIAGTDYTAVTNQQVTILAGTFGTDVNIPINDDSIVEPDEHFFVTISNPTYGALQPSGDVGLVTIADNDLKLVVNDLSVNEAAGTASVQVTSNAPAPQDVHFQYFTADGTAVEPDDYTYAFDVATLSAGATSTVIQVPILQDATEEVHEDFTVTIFDAPGATIIDDEATVTIVDDDGPPITIHDITVNENAGTVNASVTLSAPALNDVAFDAHTTAVSATDTADYTGGSSGGSITAGQTSTTVSVPILQDTVDELAETFTITLTNIVGATLGTDTATVTITDDDVPQLSVASTLTVAENAGPAQLHITSNIAPAAVVTVHVKTTTGTAGGADFTSVDTDATIGVGQTAVDVPIAIANDALDELNEQFTVTLSAPVNAAIAAATQTVTITDEDEPAWSVGDITVNEGVGTANVPITLNTPPASAYSVHAQTSFGSATAADLTATSTTVNFAAGQTSGSFDVPINDDGTVEVSESFTVTLSSPSSGTTINDGTATVTITDNDLAALTVHDLTIGEGGGSALVSITASPAPVGDATVLVQTNPGTATSGADYTTLITTATILSGQTSTTVTVPILQDGFDELNETFTVTLASPTNATIADGSATVTITDDDVPQLSVADVSLNENAGPASVRITSTMQPAVDVTVHFATTNGTAGAADFTAVDTTATIPAGSLFVDVPVPVNNDTIDENNEFFTVTLTSPTDATLGRAVGSVTIFDDDVPALSVGDVTVVENSGPAAVRITASTAPIADVTVQFTTTNGTAGAADFTSVDTTATITAGSLFVDVPVPITNDTIDENSETFTVTLTNPANATIADSAATITITDDDVPTLSIGDVTVAENNGPAVVRITANTAPIANVSVRFTTSTGTAGAADFTAVDQTVTLTAGSLFVDTPVPITNDTIDELAETFTVTLTNPANATIADDSATVTIADDDVPALSVNDVTVNEAAGTANVRVSASIAPAVDATVRFTTVNGGSDFTTVDQVVTIPAGQLFVDVPVTINDDGIDEANETFGITLTTPANATIADGAGVLTITDNDVPLVSVGDVTVAENAGPAVVRVAADIAPAVDATVRFMTETSSAGPADFTGVDQVVTIPAGQLFVDVPVAIANDGVDESSEAFGVTLSNPTNATVGRGVATVTITDDDVPVLSVGDVTVAENAGPAIVRVASNIAPVADVTARVLTSIGTAGASDFTAVDQVVTIPAGALFVDVPVAITNDAANEPTESFSVTLSNPTNATLGRSGATVTITDDDASTLSIANATVAENAGSAPLRVATDVASAGDITVRVTTTPGSATSADFTAVDQVVTIPAGQLFVDLPVTIANDAIDEVNETFTATLSAPTGATIADGSATITIIDDDVPQLTVHTATVGESDDTIAASITTDVAPLTDVVVHAAASDGTAVAGSDYTATSQDITIPAGSLGATFSVPIVSDTVNESDETFTVTLSAPSSNAQIAGPTAGVTILDDDAVRMSIGDARVDEAVGSVVLPLTLTDPAARDVTFTATPTPGTASGDDFAAAPISGSIPTGATSGTVVIPITNDIADELTESFTVTLSNVRGVGVDRATASAAIVDDDIPAVTVHSRSADEGDGRARIVISSNTATLEPIVMQFETIGGTATSGVDFTPVSTTATIPAGQTTTRVDVPILQDGEVESRETFTARISSLSYGTIERAEGIVRISDDDSPSPTTIFPPRTTTTSTAPPPIVTTTTVAVSTSTTIATSTTLLPTITTLPPTPPTSLDVIVTNETTPPTTRVTTPPTSRVTVLETPSVTAAHSTPTTDEHATDEQAADEHAAPADDHAAPADDHAASEGEHAVAEGHAEEHELDHASLTHDVPRPHDVSMRLSDLVKSAGVAGALLLLFAFPSELFDATWEHNESRIRRAFSFMPTIKAPATPPARFLSSLVCVLGAGLIFTFLESKPGFDMQTVMVTLGCMIAVALTNFGLVTPEFFYMRGKVHEKGVLNTVPGGLIVAALCVVASKFLKFHPGYVYGVVAGWEFQTKLSRRDEGVLGMISAWALIAFAFIAWFLREPVGRLVDETHAAPWVALEVSLTVLFILAVENALIGLIPLRLIKGYRLWKWSKVAWFATAFTVAMVFTHILVTPNNGSFSPSHASTYKILMIFGVFGALSVVFYAWFRFRPDPYLKTHPEAAHG